MECIAYHFQWKLEFLISGHLSKHMPNSYGLRYHFKHPLDVTVRGRIVHSVTDQSAVVRHLSNIPITLYAKFGVNTLEIIIDSCVYKSLFTSVHL